MAVALIFTIILTFTFIFFAGYFLPVVIAYIRGHKNILPITIMTIFLGWTFLGWLAAFLWSLNGDIESDSDSKKSEESGCN